MLRTLKLGFGAVTLILGSAAQTAHANTIEMQFRASITSGFTCERFYADGVQQSGTCLSQNLSPVLVSGLGGEISDVNVSSAGKWQNGTPETVGSASAITLLQGKGGFWGGSSFENELLSKNDTGVAPVGSVVSIEDRRFLNWNGQTNWGARYLELGSAAYATSFSAIGDRFLYTGFSLKRQLWHDFSPPSDLSDLYNVSPEQLFFEMTSTDIKRRWFGIRAEVVTMSCSAAIYSSCDFNSRTERDWGYSGRAISFRVKEIPAPDTISTLIAGLLGLFVAKAKKRKSA